MVRIGNKRRNFAMQFHLLCFFMLYKIFAYLLDKTQKQYQADRCLCICDISGRYDKLNAKEINGDEFENKTQVRQYHKFKTQTVLLSGYERKYSRMQLVKIMEDSLKKTRGDMVC